MNSLAAATRSAVVAIAQESRDWLDYVGIGSGAIGALMAAGAIVYAAMQARNLKRDMIRERRLEFELGLLAEIRRQMSITQFQHLSGHVGALVSDPTDESELAILRASVGVNAPEGAIRRKKDIVADAKRKEEDVQTALLKIAREEVDAAIRRRLS